MVSETKDPAKVRAGTIGSRRRWGDHVPARVSLAGLTPEQKRLVLALVAAGRAMPPPDDRAA